MLVKVYVGVGSWTCGTTVQLIACPHVGDQVEVDDVTITAEIVTICGRAVIVQAPHACQSQESFDEFKRLGWK